MPEIHRIFEPVALLFALLDSLEELMLGSHLSVPEFWWLVRAGSFSDSRLESQLFDTTLRFLNCNCLDF